MTGAVLVCGDYVVTAPDHPPLRSAAVLAKNGKVVEVGDAESLRGKNPEACVIGGAGHVVLPGFIDAHQHGRGLTNIQRGVGDGFLEQWLVRLRGLWPLDPYLSATAAAIRLVRSGVTTTLHHFASVGLYALQDEMDAFLQAYKDVGLRVTFSFDFRDRYSYVYADDKEFLLSLGDSLSVEVAKKLPPRVLPLPRQSNNLIRLMRGKYESEQIRFAIGPQGADWSTDAALSEIADLAKKEDLPIHSHMLETRLQREASLREHGKTPVKRFAHFGLLGPFTSLAHMVCADSEDLNLVRDTGARVVHNPASNLRLRSGVAPISDMLERGIPVAIGMDGMSISDKGDFFQDLRLCSNLHFTASGNALSPDSLWRMLYDGGSKATFWGEKIGSLRSGANADVVVMKMETSPTIAPVDPDWTILNRVLREGSADKITSVVVGGRIVFDDGAIKTIDEDAIHDRIKAQAERVDRSNLKNHRALVAQLENAVVDYYAKWPRDRAFNTTQLH